MVLWSCLASCWGYNRECATLIIQFLLWPLCETQECWYCWVCVDLTWVPLCSTAHQQPVPLMVSPDRTGPAAAAQAGVVCEVAGTTQWCHPTTGAQVPVS